MSETLRLDKWLWFARFAKTRADAQKLIDRGQITLNGALVQKTAAAVKAGDTLIIVIGSMRHEIGVKGLGTRRGPAPEAQALYERTKDMERLAWDEAALPLRVRIP